MLQRILVTRGRIHQIFKDTYGFAVKNNGSLVILGKENALAAFGPSQWDEVNAESTPEISPDDQRQSQEFINTRDKHD